MAEQYNYYQYRDKTSDLEKTKEASKASNEAMNSWAMTPKVDKNIVSKIKDVGEAKYRDNFLKSQDEARVPYNAPLIFKTDSQQAEADALAELRRETETIENTTILANGQFRFNDQVLNISPEQIAIHVDEYENSILLMRSETPVTTQSGKKRIRIIVSFPVDIGQGYSQLAKMIVQIKKTPIATIENEKIRTELFGHLQDFENIGVVVDNLSGYVEEDFPTLIRCTLQMTWFNHAPYAESLRYKEQIGDREIYQTAPSSLFKKFYMEGASNGTVMYNDPSFMPNHEALVIMYKEYKQHDDTFTVSKMDQRDRLSSTTKNITQDNFYKQKELEADGWYLAEEDQDKIGDVIEGVWYRWKRFEVPYTDLDTSGALILQNASFSLSTNPSYINMEKYSVPTIQFLGGSVADVRAVMFAAGEHASSVDKTPVATSRSLGELQTIIKKVADDRMRFSKYSKENHLLICHPLAKLMKYKSFAQHGLSYNYITPEGNIEKFNIDDFLPVTASTINSTTIPGLPFASRVQIDFKETRLAKAHKPIVHIGEAGSSDVAIGPRVELNIIRKIYRNNGIFLNSQGFFEPNPMLVRNGTPEGKKARMLCDALDALRYFDKEVFDLESAYMSKVYSKGLDGTEVIAQEDLTVSQAKNRIGRKEAMISIADAFNQNWAEQIVISLYMDFSQAVIDGEEWAADYVSDFEEYTKVRPKGYKDLYPDMMLPKDQTTASFYFADNEKRVKNFKSDILRNMPKNYDNMQKGLANKLLNKKFADEIGPDVKPTSVTQFNAAFNYAATAAGRDKGAPRLQILNNPNYRILATQQAIADATPPTYSLAQVYPTFQVQLFTNKYNYAQAESAVDQNASELKSEQQTDLFDIFDLSSIIDIRIIKDEYEAADVMIIRILGSHKTLMTNQNKDPGYDPSTFSYRKLMSDIIDGKTTAAGVNNTNLEDVGLKEGVKIRCFLGNSIIADELGLEFNGRIAAINGKDVIEIYCVGDGHEFIQNTLGYKGDEKTQKYSWNSDTTDLIGELLATADEIKSFGNTKLQVLKKIGLNLPAFMGGRSALDNVYAPRIHPEFSIGDFLMGAFDTSLSTFSTVFGIGTVLGGTTAVLTSLGLVASTGGAVGLVAVTAVAAGLVTETWDAVGKKFNPCQFTVYQQSFWDVLQELTLRHPGYVCSVVPFDTRSTLYFGEPDGIYFYRGIESAAERAIVAQAMMKSRGIFKNATLREIYDANSKLRANNPEVAESSYPFLLPNAKTQQKTFFEALQQKGSNTETMTLMAMQKSFRAYHLITSENDIVSNDMEASSMDVANSVQVYHPTDDNEGNPDGTTWFSNYALTDRMKADDDLNSNLVNNKVFTFHNAHNEYPEIELPQRYAKAVLCKELENIYKGKITILGRHGIKPHDIVILSDTHNEISGPVKVGRVVQSVSPETGWITHIYPKFIAIPDTSAGAFQMKAVLKACRYWLGAHTELFYSNMKKFTPDEVADNGKRGRDIERAFEMGFNDPEYLDEEDFSKEDLEAVGEHAALTTSGVNAAEEATYMSGQIVGKNATGVGRSLKKVAGKLGGISDSNGTTAGNAKSLVDLRIRDAKKIGIQGRKFVKAGKTVLDTKKASAGLGLIGQGAKSIFATSKILARVGGSTALAFGGGFLAEHILSSAIDGIVSYMKYREPISIFPLAKDGKPWMAALNGYKENTIIEHLELSAAQAADRLGMISYLIQKGISEWNGDLPMDVGAKGKYQVIGQPYDGDTFSIRNGSETEKIRIKGFDTGELKAFEGGAEPGPVEKEMGLKARDRLRELIASNGNQVEIERHGPDATQKRTAATVTINGINVAEVMKNEYLAMNYAKNTKRDYSKSLPPHLKNNAEAIAQEREKAWIELKKKHEFRKKNGR